MTYTDEYAAKRRALWLDRVQGQNTSWSDDDVAVHIVAQERELDERRHQAQLLVCAETILADAGLVPDVGAACAAIVAYLREVEAKKVWRTTQDHERIKQARTEVEQRHAELVAALSDLVKPPESPQPCQSCGVMVYDNSDACEACRSSE